MSESKFDHSYENIYDVIKGQNKEITETKVTEIRDTLVECIAKDNIAFSELAEIIYENNNPETGIAILQILLSIAGGPQNLYGWAKLAQKETAENKDN